MPDLSVEAPAEVSPSVYADLGVPPVINAWGTMTRLGGSLMDPRVLEAMEEASHAFVDIPTLQLAAGRRIANLLGAEAACITAGAAAGLAVASAACMTGGKAAKVAQLPDVSGMPDVVLMLASHRFQYDGAVRLSGARIVDVGQPEKARLRDVEAALYSDVAMFLYTGQEEFVAGSIALEELAPLLQEHGVPLVVDAAAEIPPRERIPRYFAQGASLVILSGGKALRGPQSSGLILGRADLVEQCAANNYPNVSVGRSMKTDKETIVGLLRAVEIYCETDEDETRAGWEQVVDELLRGLPSTSQVTVRRVIPTIPDIQPLNIPRVYIGGDRIEPARVQRLLLDRRPRPVAVGVSVDGAEVALNPQCLRLEEVPEVVKALREVLPL